MPVMTIKNVFNIDKCPLSINKSPPVAENQSVDFSNPLLTTDVPESQV